MTPFKRKNKNGSTSYVVRWREDGVRKSRSFASHADAREFEVRTLARLQEEKDGLADRGKIRLDAFMAEWWEQHGRQLAESTQESYASHWDNHVGPSLGHYTLKELSDRPEIVQQWFGKLRTSGLAETSQARILTMVQGILQRAIEYRRIRFNPVTTISKKPKQRAKKRIDPITPKGVEKVLAELRAEGKYMEATFTAVLAYSGMRPGEVRGLTWRHIGDRTIRVEQSMADWKMKGTKTGVNRNVRLLAPLAADLAAWKQETSHADPDDPVFPNCHGQHWTKDDYKNFIRRAFRPAVGAAGVTLKQPYDLRHAFTSLLIFEGRNAPEVARQMGNSPTMTLDTYTHVFEEHDPDNRLSAEEQIARARQEGAESGPMVDPQPPACGFMNRAGFPGGHFIRQA